MSTDLEIRTETPEVDAAPLEQPTSPSTARRRNPRRNGHSSPEGIAVTIPASLKELVWERDVYPQAETILRRLIRFQTVNPPGNEKPAARYLAGILRREGLEPELYEGSPGRTNVICRLKGTGEKPPLQLNGHLDVVAAVEDQWSHPPFAAEVADGCIWGRGTVDMKQMVTMNLMALIILKRLNIALKRDIIFTAVADEETGGTWGSKYLVENHADKIRAEYCLGEIGGFSATIAGETFYPVQVAEKGLCWFDLVAIGQGGHGSIPDHQAALVRLSEAILKLVRQGLPLHSNPLAEEILSMLSKNQPFPKNIFSRILLNSRISDLMVERLIPDKGLAATILAMLRNTANPTMVNAGEKSNIVPSVAKAHIDGRILPGQTTESYLKEVRDLVGPGFEINVLKELKPTMGDPKDPIMGAIDRVIQRHDPGAIVLPAMISATTDGTHYATLGTKYFGFSPVKFRNNESFVRMFHGHDEHIPIDGFHFGIRVLTELVEDLST
jgi:acetylornithine deacetylase/succinyl-diaminopimelate desuccinylase-like protein